MHIHSFISSIVLPFFHSITSIHISRHFIYLVPENGKTKQNKTEKHDRVPVPSSFLRQKYSYIIIAQDIIILYKCNRSFSHLLALSPCVYLNIQSVLLLKTSTRIDIIKLAFESWHHHLLLFLWPWDFDRFSLSKSFHFLEPPFPLNSQHLLRV